ncbi:nicotinate-nicotinamide nucleotide adenylyltransferase [Marinicella sp. S1101]|uniref:nicotinate-nicotinamide nucleotide adenylyltransferase n=1 Tax=Marinicella marina TaxID=2996016 RepID=UPI002260BAD8|nr:nicotinate-nicotinamide nucleotide adenylyltransferase [Marinicella marina]MCX7554902.1 nicotinate-nicotinamide nucleotide adenylyltransferase [Marinicella marina]
MHTLLFGLTADPIHKGHEQVILNSFEFAKNNGIQIEQLLLIPTYQPNLIAGKSQPQSAFRARFEMCELVAEGIRKNLKLPVYVTDIEKQLYDLNGVKSYSYDTLHATEVKHKLFVLSADHFSGRWPKFRKWHQWQRLVKENGLMIHQRPGHGINASFIQQLKTINPAIHVVEGLPQIDVSSTELRAKLKSQPIDTISHLDEAVKAFIESHEIY